MDFRKLELEIENFFNLDSKIDQSFLFQANDSHENLGSSLCSPGATVVGEKISFNNHLSKSGEQGQHQEIKKCSKKKVIRESNPNLLKNLVATLRSWIKIKYVHEEEYAQILWNHFMHTHKINQKLLKLCFGVQNATIEQMEDVFEKQRNDLMIKNFDVFKLIQAQQYIRESVLQQLQENDIEYILQNRRVKEKLQFRQYFHNFVSQLESGGISRNCNVQKEKGISQSI